MRITLHAVHADDYRGLAHSGGTDAARPAGSPLRSRGAYVSGRHETGTGDDTVRRADADGRRSAEAGTSPAADVDAVARGGASRASRRRRRGPVGSSGPVRCPGGVVRTARSRRGASGSRRRKGCAVPAGRTRLQVRVLVDGRGHLGRAGPRKRPRPPVGPRSPTQLPHLARQLGQLFLLLAVQSVFSVTLQGEDGSGDDRHAVEAAAGSCGRTRQDFSVATARSTGARAADKARLIVRWVAVRSWCGGRLISVVTQDPAPMQARSARTATPWGEIHSSLPAGSATTCTFTPWRRCFREKSARLSATRSHSASVPSSRT